MNNRNGLAVGVGEVWGADSPPHRRATPGCEEVLFGSALFLRSQLAQRGSGRGRKGASGPFRWQGSMGSTPGPLRPQHHTGNHKGQGPRPPVEVAASPWGSLAGAPLKSSPLPPQPLVMDGRRTLPASQPHPEERATQCPQSRQEAEGVLGCFQARFWPCTISGGRGGTRGSQLLSEPPFQAGELGEPPDTGPGPHTNLAPPVSAPPNQTGVRVRPRAPGQPGAGRVSSPPVTGARGAPAPCLC